MIKHEISGTLLALNLTEIEYGRAIGRNHGKAKEKSGWYVNFSATGEGPRRRFCAGWDCSVK
ncbi:MAG: hypothetical protein ACI92Z_003201 [Paracoccaceae bacterium]|jgi:hypothetical protein